MDPTSEPRGLFGHVEQTANEKLMEAIRQAVILHNKTTGLLLREVVLVGMVDAGVILGCKQEFHWRQLTKGDHAPLIEKAARRIIGDRKVYFMVLARPA